MTGITMTSTIGTETTTGTITTGIAIGTIMAGTIATGTTTVIIAAAGIVIATGRGTIIIRSEFAKRGGNAGTDPAATH